MNVSPSISSAFCSIKKSPVGEFLCLEKSRMVNYKESFNSTTTVRLTTKQVSLRLLHCTEQAPFHNISYYKLLICKCAFL